MTDKTPPGASKKTDANQSCLKSAKIKHTPIRYIEEIL